MDISLRGLYSNCILNLPTIIKTAVLANLGRSENAEHQDVLTEIVAVAARPILGTPASLKQSQDAFKVDHGVFGRMWVSKYTVPIQAHPSVSGAGLDVAAAVSFGISVLQPPGGVDIQHLHPSPVAMEQNVETEWTGYRRDASVFSRLPKETDAKLYQAMMMDVAASGPTILYFHGGAHCLMDPVTHRLTTSALARESGGRVLSVRYRLSPQHMFPAALVDALTAYLALIYPPPGAFHDPVPTRQIVLAGDSSGAGIGASLLLLLMTLVREKISISFHGASITIPQPPCAGLALASPWLDVSRSLPSCSENAKWDIIAPPPLDAASPPFPPDLIWPTSPPRADPYCAAHLVSHPLVSPLAARPHHWQGAPPVFISVGWEGMQDEAEVFARRVYLGNPVDAKVVFDGYEGMPHCFSVLPWNWAGRKALRDWGRFCYYVVQEQPMPVRQKKRNRNQSMPARVCAEEDDIVWARLFDPDKREYGTWTSSKTGEMKEIRLAELGLTQLGCGRRRKAQLDEAEVDQRMNDSMRWRVKLEEDMVKRWKGGQVP